MIGVEPLNGSNFDFNGAYDFWYKNDVVQTETDFYQKYVNQKLEGLSIENYSMKGTIASFSYKGILHKDKALDIMPTAALAGGSAYAYNQYSIGCVVDGKHMSFSDASPYIDENNRTMIPLRVVSEYLNCTVVWAADTETISIYDAVKKTNYEFVIGKKSIQQMIKVSLWIQHQ